MADELNSDRAATKIKHFKELKSGRSAHEGYWQSLHDYFYIEGSDISSVSSPGSELNVNNLWDSTTLDCADVLASGFMNYLTPQTSKWFRLRSKNPAHAENKAIGDFLSDVSDELIYTLSHSNFYDEILPAYKSSGVYGTSIILAEEDMEDDVRFLNLPIKQVCIVDDARGRACEFYIEFEYTAFQAETRWGKEKLSEEMKKEAESRSEKKHLFLLFIGKRSARDVRKDNRANMQVEALWIDVENKKTMDEGGYNEFPCFAHRFDKRPFMPWGYSPAMKSLPFARLLNAIAKTDLRRAMKETDPAMAAPDNAFIMPMNMNPRGINYYKKDALGSNPANSVFPLGGYGNPQTGLEKIQYYTNSVRSLMFYDVFLAFNSLDKQMNNPEVMERINEKMTMMGGAVGRWTQVDSQIIARLIGILSRRGKLPEMPDEMADDPNYEIDYVSRLAQAQKSSELNALNIGLTTIAQMAQFMPDVLDKVDPDKVVDETWSITGAPIRVLRDDSEIAKIREARGQQQAQAQEMAIMSAMAETGAKAGQADKSMAEAKNMGKK
jgi:hypothetical protein